MTTKQINRQTALQANHLNDMAFRFADEHVRSVIESMTVPITNHDDDGDEFRYDVTQISDLCEDDVHDALNYLSARDDRDLPYTVHFEGNLMWFEDL